MALTYEAAAFTRSGTQRVHTYASETPLGPGDVIRMSGRDWLVERVEADTDPPRLTMKPARYRLRLRHPDGREELGAFRRWRSDAPGVGHSFSTIEDGQPAAWTVTDAHLARDEQDEPYLDVVAERDFGELDGLPNHELEHALDNRDADIPEAAQATLARAEEAGLAAELAALEVGEEPDWAEAERYIDALELEEIEDDLLELCGVRPDSDPRETWLGTVKERLRSDLERFRADIEGDHDEIEEWDFRDGRIFASVGNVDDEANPDVGHGWLSRLVDSGVLTVAGFRRVRKTEL
jgi:hypothetical protein